VTRTFRNGVLAGLAAAGATAAVLAFTRRSSRQGRETDVHYPGYDDPVDEATAESFPASDPPSHAATLGATAATGRR
jgi:hypothetical protein